MNPETPNDTHPEAFDRDMPTTFQPETKGGETRSESQDQQAAELINRRDPAEAAPVDVPSVTGAASVVGAFLLSIGNPPKTPTQRVEAERYSAMLDTHEDNIGFINNPNGRWVPYEVTHSLAAELETALRERDETLQQLSTEHTARLAAEEDVKRLNFILSPRKSLGIVEVDSVTE